MSEIIFPFAGPSPPNTPDPNKGAMASPDIPQTPNPGTLLVRNNRFHYPLEGNLSTEETTTQAATTCQTPSIGRSLLQPTSAIPRSTTVARMHPYDDNTSVCATKPAATGQQPAIDTNLLHPLPFLPRSTTVARMPQINDTTSGSTTEPATTGQQHAVNANLLQPSSAFPHSITSARICQVNDTTAFPRPPPKAHTRKRSNSEPPFEHSNGRKLTKPVLSNNPFVDDNAIELAPPPKPWLKGEFGHTSFEPRSVDSSATSFRTPTGEAAVPDAYPQHGVGSASQPFDAPQSSFGVQPSSVSQPSIGTQPSIASQPSVSSSLIGLLRNNPRFSLDRNVRDRKVLKRYVNKLRLAREREEARRLGPNVPPSTLVLLPDRVLAQRISDPKYPIPPILTNAYFWAAFLLLQSGFVSTAAMLGVIFEGDKVDGKIVVSNAKAFLLVCSLAAALVGSFFSIVIFLSEYKMCLGFVDKLGLNEVLDLHHGDLEMGRRGGGGGLIYLGVGARDDSSTLGGSRMRLARARAGRAGRSLCPHGIPDRSIFKDPIWMDLYTTPEYAKLGLQTDDPTPKESSKLKYSELASEDGDPMDISTQRLLPSPNARSEVASLVSEAEAEAEAEYEDTSTIVEDEEREIPNRDGARGRCGFRGMRDKDDESEYHSLRTIPTNETEVEDWESAKSSPHEEGSEVKDKTAAALKEINTCSPLDRLGRALGMNGKFLCARFNSRSN